MIDNAPADTQDMNGNLSKDKQQFPKDNLTTTLKDAIKIFGDNTEDTYIPTMYTDNAPTTTEFTSVYTDSACINNGDNNAAAGLGIWYEDGNPRNVSMRVPIAQQSNQSGELMAILTAAKRHPPNKNLRIISNSRYTIDRLTKHLKKWEAKDWADSHHGTLFKCITAWLRWRPGKTNLKWVKGHSRIKGNEEADRLASEGATKPMLPDATPLEFPLNLTTNGATLAYLNQKDLYHIILNKNKTPKMSG